MIRGYYALFQAVEILFGTWILYNIYPEVRKKRKWILCFWGAVYVILSMSYVWNGCDSYISNIAVCAFSVKFSLVYCCFFEAEFSTVFRMQLLYLISISFLKLPALILECMVLGRSLIAVNRGSRTIWECIWYTVLVLAVAAAFAAGKKEAFIRYIRSVYALISKEKGLTLAIACILWFLLGYGMRPGKIGFHTMDFIFSVMLVFGTFLCMHYLLLRTAYREVKLDHDRLDISQELLQRQNKEIHEIYRKNRKYLHEYHHTMEYLYYCVKDKKYEEAEDFLGRHLAVLKKENRQVWTGLPFLDFIINYKKQAMDSKDIVFQLELDIYEYPFEEAELGILLGNLLDNAIEACEKCEPGRRNIYLKIWNVKYMFLLKMVNSSSKYPELREQRFITDKADKKIHGMGTEQVRRIVEKYGGDISFQYSREDFETKIIVSTMKGEPEK